MKQGLTELVLLLDRSGSMEVIKKDMEGALASLLAEQRRVPGECGLTYFSFDNELVHHFSAGSLDSKVTIEPRGSTALLDALCQSIDRVGERLSKLPTGERPEQVIFVVVTDGEENSSRTFKRQDVFERIKRQTDQYGWKFVYLGANQDAFAEASQLGFMSNNIAAYQASASGVRSMGNDLCAYVTTSRTTGSASFNGSP